MGSALGVRKIAAGRAGLTLDEYDARIAAGEKWCTGCRKWHPRTEFGSDRSRGDGLASSCAASRVVAVGRPGARERRQQRAAGFAWCSGCKSWLPVDNVSRQGLCAPHAAERGRLYYAANAATIRPRKRARTRGLDPIPEWWREERFEEFGGLCAYGCGREASDLDHVWPVARGGRSEPSNLVPACKTCNSSKKANDPSPWLDRFVDAFPDQSEALVALTYEHASSLDLDALPWSEFPAGPARAAA